MMMELNGAEPIRMKPGSETIREGALNPCALFEVLPPDNHGDPMIQIIEKGHQLIGCESFLAPKSDGLFGLWIDPEANPNPTPRRMKSEVFLWAGARFDLQVSSGTLADVGLLPLKKILNRGEVAFPSKGL